MKVGLLWISFIFLLEMLINWLFFGCSGLVGRKWFLENLLSIMIYLLLVLLVLYRVVWLCFGWYCMLSFWWM